MKLPRFFTRDASASDINADPGVRPPLVGPSTLGDPVVLREISRSAPSEQADTGLSQESFAAPVSSFPPLAPSVAFDGPLPAHSLPTSESPSSATPAEAPSVAMTQPTAPDRDTSLAVPPGAQVATHAEITTPVPVPAGTTRSRAQGEPLLRMRSIARTFEVPDAPPLHILTDINLDVYPGEHIAIVGRSGTGKSTLLNILGLIDQASSGSYLLNGVDTTTLSDSRRAHLRGRTFGFVFQTFNLITGLSTTENVAAPLLYDRGLAFWTRTARAEELLTAVGLEDKIDGHINRLSGGEQQRVAIARALARRPRIILADEPTGALDVDTGATVMSLLEAQCQETGAALIVITHDLAVASRASTQYRLEHGRLTSITMDRRTHGSLQALEEVSG